MNHNSEEVRKEHLHERVTERREEKVQGVGSGVGTGTMSEVIINFFN